MASNFDWLDTTLLAPAREIRAPRHECGVNVTVCIWSDDEWAAHGHVVEQVQTLVAGAFNLALSTEDMEEDILGAHGDLFAEACVEKTADSEFQVTLVTHETAESDGF